MCEDDCRTPRTECELAPLLFVTRRFTGSLNCGSELWEILVDVFAVQDSYVGYCVGFDFQSDSIFANSDPVICAVALYLFQFLDVGRFANLLDVGNDFSDTLLYCL